MAKNETMATAVISAFLGAGKTVDHASSLLLAADVYLLGGHTACMTSGALLAAGVMAAMLEKYFAWRVAIDAELFAVLERYPDEANDFDHAIAMCLNRPRTRSKTRSMESRVQGAARACRLQLVACALQVILTFSAIVM